MTGPGDLDGLAAPAQPAEQAGPVDILVNNAGFSWFGPTAADSGRTAI